MYRNTAISALTLLIVAGLALSASCSSTAALGSLEPQIEAEQPDTMPPGVAAAAPDRAASGWIETLSTDILDLLFPGYAVPKKPVVGPLNQQGGAAQQKNNRLLPAVQRR